MRIRATLALACLFLPVLGCGGGGGGDGDDPVAVSLTASRAAPGEAITLEHGSLAAGEAVTVTFTGPGGQQASSLAFPSVDGAVTVAVPPLLDPDTQLFSGGTASVSIPGAAPASLEIDALPLLWSDVEPGEVTADVLAFTVDKMNAVLSKLQTSPAMSGVDTDALSASLEGWVAALQSVAEDLAADGVLTVSVEGGTVDLSGDDLVLLDRCLAAYFAGLAPATAMRTTAARTAAAEIITREGWVEILETVRDQAIPGMQTMGSYVSLVCTLGSLVPVLQPVTVPVALSSAAVTTLGAAAVSIAIDASIAAIEGRGIDESQAADHAVEVLVDGFESMAATFGGAFSWAGQGLATLYSVALDVANLVGAAQDYVCEAAGLERVAVRALPAGDDEYCSALGYEIPVDTDSGCDHLPFTEGYWTVEWTEDWVCTDGSGWPGVRSDSFTMGLEVWELDGGVCSLVVKTLGIYDPSVAGSTMSYGVELSYNETKKILTLTGEMESPDSVTLTGTVEDWEVDSDTGLSCTVHVQHELTLEQPYDF